MTNAKFQIPNNRDSETARHGDGQKQRDGNFFAILSPSHSIAESLCYRVGIET